MGFLNGLSALGASTAAFAGTAGLEAQKASLAQDSLKLADQLATTRESVGRQEAGDIAAKAAEKDQQFRAGEGAANRASSEKNTQTSASAQLGAASIHAKSAVDVANIQANAPPEIIKTLRALNQLPPSSSSPTNTAGNSSSGASSGASASGSSPSATSTTADASGVGTQAQPSPNSENANALVLKALGLPASGSEADVRQKVAKGINEDPLFSGATEEQKSLELEKRIAIAKGTIANPKSQELIADAIAKYQTGALKDNALRQPGALDTMALVLKKNPQYDETIFPSRLEAQKAIAPGGTLFTPISAMNVSMGHAEHFLALAKELGNYGGGNWANIIPNTLAQKTGSGSIVNSMQQTAFAMAEEGNRIYAGNAGTEGAINNWYKSFPVNGSLSEQVAAVKNFAALMGDKFDSMTYQTNQTLGRSGQPSVELLTPKAAATFEKLMNMDANGKTAPNRPPLSDVLKLPQ